MINPFVLILLTFSIIILIMFTVRVYNWHTLKMKRKPEPTWRVVREVQGKSKKFWIERRVGPGYEWVKEQGMLKTPLCMTSRRDAVLYIRQKTRVEKSSTRVVYSR